MRDPLKESGESERVEREASVWVLRLDRGLTAIEQDQFSQWLGADSRHGACLARHRRNWERLDLLIKWRPEHTAEPNEDLLARPSRWWWRERPRWFATLTLAAAAVVASFILARGKAPSPTVISAESNAYAPIETRPLLDGSVVELNRGAELAVSYTKEKRDVRLRRGEAHFSVAKDPQRPFIVGVAGVEVQAVGTQFDVRLDEHQVAVFVTEGQVQVDRRYLVRPGEQALVSLPPGSASVRIKAVPAANADSILAWRPRMLDLSGVSMADVVAAFNRHNAAELIIGDPSLSTIRVSALLRSDDVDGVVRLLERSFDIRAERVGRVVILRRAP